MTLAADNHLKGNRLGAQKVLVLAVFLTLAGCSGGDHLADVRGFMKDVTARPVPSIKPLPEFKPYEAFKYGAANQRSPFQPPMVIPDDSRGNAPSLVQPPANHKRAYLEQFNIASLSLVGSLEIGSAYYGLIKDQDGLIHQVGVGDYIGTQWGRIERIEEAHVELVEIVSNGGGGWLRRPRTIEMNQTGE